MTLQELVKAANISEDLAAVWISPLNRAFIEDRIDTPLRQAHFIAQVGHESNSFKSLRENLNYSVEGLLKTFSRSRISEADAKKYGRKDGQAANQEMIANTVYGGDWGLKNLGNMQTGDGWKYRGAGLIQLTGRANFVKANKALNFDLVNRPERVAEDNLIAALAAGWFWEENGLNILADKDDVVAITKKINGGTNGLDNRKQRLVVAKKALGI